MSKTRTQLANRALEKLLLVGSGESPASEDTAKADGVIDSFAAFISGTGLYTISDLAAIEDDAFEWLALYLAYLIAPDFGLPQNDAMRQMAEYNITLLTSTDPTREPVTVDYF